MSERPKKISVNDLPADAAANLNEDDIQPIPDAEIKGGGRVGSLIGKRAATRVGIRVRTGSGLRDIRKINSFGETNSWIKK